MVCGSDMDELNLSVQYHLLEESQSDLEVLGCSSGLEVPGQVNARHVIFVEYSGLLGLFRVA